MEVKTDPFRPRHEPALTLYEAFQSEAAKRKGRSVAEWMEAERQAVWGAASRFALQHGLRVPLMADIEVAERYAMGSADYGAKWAYGVERAIRKGAE